MLVGYLLEPFCNSLVRVSRKAQFCFIIVLRFIAERSSAFGRLGISYGIGMVVGPLIGGFVTDHFDEQTAAGTAMLGSVISVIIVILFIPHNTKKKGILNSFSNNYVILANDMCFGKQLFWKFYKELKLGKFLTLYAKCLKSS